MSKVIVRSGQTLADVAIEHLGSNQGLYELARINGLNITSQPTAGQLLTLPEIIDERVVAAFDARINKPAANLAQGLLELDGIGVWIVGDTFIVQ